MKQLQDPFRSLPVLAIVWRVWIGVDGVFLVSTWYYQGRTRKTIQQSVLSEIWMCSAPKAVRWTDKAHRILFIASQLDGEGLSDDAY